MLLRRLFCIKIKWKNDYGNNRLRRGIRRLENVIIDKECRDTDIRVITEEIEIFFRDKADQFTFENKYFYLQNTNICLSGDNLITKKQMWRRINHQRKTPNSVDNDQVFSAYIVLPRIKNDYRSNVNNARSSTWGYNDNPFVFFNVLRDMYICYFDEKKISKQLDWVEKAIIQTKVFWELFGRGEEGYKNCEESFCVRGIRELCEEEKYKAFLCKGIPPKDDWKLYEELLEKLRTIRKKQMLKRLETIKGL